MQSMELDLPCERLRVAPIGMKLSNLKLRYRSSLSDELA